MSRLYTPVDGDALVARNDAEVSPAGVRRLPAAATELMDCGDHSAVCDDVFCVHVDEDDRHNRHKQFIHVWAQYRIAQRGIMVSYTVHQFHRVDVTVGSGEIFNLPQSSILFQQMFCSDHLSICV